jgi:hypothetical protein
MDHAQVFEQRPPISAGEQDEGMGTKDGKRYPSR